MSLLENTEALASFFDYVDMRYYHEDDGWARPYGTCTYLNSSMILLLREEGRMCLIFGADEAAMHTAPLWGYHGGHDWLLVDDRYVVDLWVPAYLCQKEPCRVWDLHVKASPYLPARELWEPTILQEPDLERWIAEGDEDWRAYLKRFQIDAGQPTE